MGWILSLWKQGKEGSVSPWKEFVGVWVWKDLGFGFTGISQGLSHFISHLSTSFPWHGKFWDLFFPGFLGVCPVLFPISRPRSYGMEEFGIWFSRDLLGFVPFHFPSLDVVPMAWKNLGFAFPRISPINGVCPILFPILDVIPMAQKDLGFAFPGISWGLAHFTSHPSIPGRFLRDFLLFGARFWVGMRGFSQRNS